MPQHRRIGVEYESSVQADSKIAETWIVLLSRAGKLARCWLLISDTRPYWEHRFCETCELKYAKERSDISKTTDCDFTPCVGLGSHGIDVSAEFRIYMSGE